MDTFEILKKELPEYINQIKNSNSEAKIIHEFTSFIQTVFAIEAKELDFEVSVKSNVRKVSGRIDAVFGDIILEFKKDLKDNRVLEIAINELEKYFQSLYEVNPKTRHLGIATDGINFKVFQAIIENNQISKLDHINEINVELNSPEIVFNWFDSYFFSSSKITPTSEHLKQMFGLNSPTYAVARQELLELFDKVRDNRRIKTKYANWARFLEIVYGDKPNEINLFIAHTYLSTFVKLLVYLKITSKNKFRSYDILPILYGNVFSQLGIRNFVEDDFFTWIMFVTIRKRASGIFEKILLDLEVYDLDKINEDILKELYQELVKPDVRKRLGEFYTPDWLAEKMIEEVLSEDPKKSVLDPSCGSGTFLFKTILYKIKNLRKSGMGDLEILSHILKNVIGFDVHPLAALIAKTNYLLGLIDIIYARKGPITVPVYLSDSIKIPSKKNEITNTIPTFEFSTEITDKKFAFPESIVEDITIMDDVIEKMKEHGHEFEEKVGTITDGAYKIDLKVVSTNLQNSFERSISFIKNDLEKEILVKNIKTLFDLILENSDSIWPYVLRNMYKPLALTNRKVDILIGNPPWLPMKDMKNEYYQGYLKSESKKYELIDPKRSQVIPHIELATLFFAKCADQYLKDNGSIAFVMPRSVISASHHKKFREFKKPLIKLTKIYDLENVEPLFRIISCVIIGRKGEATKYPIEGIEISGKLKKFNEQLIDAKRLLVQKEIKYSPPQESEDHSFYYKKFLDGATIYPRCFYYVNIKPDTIFGFNPEEPYIISEINSNAKEPWNISCEGNMESKFLVSSILSTDIMPFHIKQHRLTFLPIILKNEKVNLIKNNEEESISSLSSPYFKNVEQLWHKYRTGKSSKYSVYEYLDYHGKLSAQNPLTRYKVVYNATGANIVSCVLEPQKTYSFKIDNKEFQTNGIFIDHSCFYFDCKNKEEAHYVCAVLNSPILDLLIKPLQAKGSFGPRSIHLLPLTFPIPQFDVDNKDHSRLTELSELCHKKIQKEIVQIKQKSSARIRGVIRNSINQELNEINEIVKKLLKKQPEMSFSA